MLDGVVQVIFAVKTDDQADLEFLDILIARYRSSGRQHFAAAVPAAAARMRLLLQGGGPHMRLEWLGANALPPAAA
jgi:hypothetical protein